MGLALTCNKSLFYICVIYSLNATLMFRTAYGIAVSKYLFVYIFILPHTYHRGRNCHQKMQPNSLPTFTAMVKQKHHGSTSSFRRVSLLLVAMAAMRQNYSSQNAIFCTLAHVIHGGIRERRKNRKRQQNPWR